MILRTCRIAPNSYRGLDVGLERGFNRRLWYIDYDTNTGKGQWRDKNLHPLPTKQVAWSDAEKFREFTFRYADIWSPPYHTDPDLDLDEGL